MLSPSVHATQHASGSGWSGHRARAQMFIKCPKSAENPHKKQKGHNKKNSKKRRRGKSNAHSILVTGHNIVALAVIPNDPLVYTVSTLQIHLYIFTNLFFLPFFLVSKYLTLLIEINPMNNTKVIKAVDCKVKVQVGCRLFDNYHIAVRMR